MIGQPLVSVIMVTVGLASILKASGSLIWGLDDMVFVRFFSDEPIGIGFISMPEVYLWITTITIIFLVLFMWFYKKSKYGLAMRCSASDQDRALLMGISIRWVFGASWALASVVATIGGLFLANLVTVNYNLSFFALKAFPAAILGGLDSVEGVILGGLIIGVAESLAGGYIDPLLGGGVKETVAFLLLLLILVIKPYGFLGTEEIERV
jgi:branched-chain amino acid transport system permease protein